MNTYISPKTSKRNCVGSENNRVRNLYKSKNDSMVCSCFFCFITLCVSVYLDSHWWRTIQCAANSFSRGTSNRAGSNSSSRAVGLTLGSLSRHFWINSYKKKKNHTHTIWSHVTGKMFHIHQQNVQSQFYLIWPLTTFCSGSSSSCMALLMASWET